MNTTENTTQSPAAEAPKTDCSNCGACAGGAGVRVGIPEGLKTLIGGMAAAGAFDAPGEREAKKAKSVPVTLNEARAYLRGTGYTPNVLDVVRLNANGRVISDIPGNPETAVVVRVFDKPVFSGDACLHGRYGRDVVDCTLLMCIEVGGEKFYSEMLFNSVFLERAPAA